MKVLRRDSVVPSMNADKVQLANLHQQYHQMGGLLDGPAAANSPRLLAIVNNEALETGIEDSGKVSGNSFTFVSPFKATNPKL